MRENSKPRKLFRISAYDDREAHEGHEGFGTFMIVNVMLPSTLLRAGFVPFVVKFVFSSLAAARPRWGIGGALCLFFLVAASPLWDFRPGAAADAQSADAVVDSLQTNYDATVDFVADFRQETEVKTLNRNLKASGKLSFN